MKFYFRHQRAYLIEDNKGVLMDQVKSKLNGRGNMVITLNDTDGWIFEGDDYFQSYCMVKFGVAPTVITEDEYDRLVIDRIVFFSKDRTTALRTSIMATLPKK